MGESFSTSIKPVQVNSAVSPVSENGLVGKVLWGFLDWPFVLLAYYLGIGLLSVYGDWLGWRQVTGSAPNALTAMTQKITGDLFWLPG